METPDGVIVFPTPVIAHEAYQAYIKCKLSSTTHPEMDNTDHCEACRKQGKLLLHSTNFKQPCRCCGSQDHGLLTCTQEIEKEKVQNVAQVTCPSVWTTCISKILQEDRMSMKNRPCAQKFAESYNYDLTKAKLALKQCFTFGSGWHMYPQQFDALVNEVTQICYDFHNPQFTRDNSYLQSKEDDEDSTEHTDDELPWDIQVDTPTPTNKRC